MNVPLAHSLRSLYRKIPFGLRQHISKPIYRARFFVRQLGQALFPPVFVFEGKAQDGEHSFSFVYAGAHGFHPKYWARMVFVPGFQKRFLGRCFCRSLLSFLRKKGVESDFLLIEHIPITLRLLPAGKGFRIPPWVRMQIELPNLGNQAWAAQRTNICRRIRNNRLDYEIVHDPAAFDDFYYNMHLPYIRGRYEETALLETPEAVKAAFLRGGLLLIKRGGEILAGCLFEYFPDSVLVRKFGVRDGNWDYVRQGVVGAMYYFLMVEMEKREVARIGVGGVRPLLSDGVFRHKISVNAKLIPRAEGVCVWFKPLRNSPPMKDFLLNNPLVHFPKAGEPRRAIFVDAASRPSQEAFDKCLRATMNMGITGTDIFVFGERLDIPGLGTTPATQSAIIKPAQDLFVHQ